MLPPAFSVIPAVVERVPRGQPHRKRSHLPLPLHGPQGQTLHHGKNNGNMWGHAINMRHPQFLSSTWFLDGQCPRQMLLLGNQSRLCEASRISRPSAPLRKAVFSADVRTDHISNLQALIVSKHEVAVRCEQRVYIRGGPSASGKKYVDIKFRC